MLTFCNFVDLPFFLFFLFPFFLFFLIVLSLNSYSLIYLNLSKYFYLTLHFCCFSFPPPCWRVFFAYSLSWLSALVLCSVSVSFHSVAHWFVHFLFLCPQGLCAPLDCFGFVCVCVYVPCFCYYPPATAFAICLGFFFSSFLFFIC